MNNFSAAGNVTIDKTQTCVLYDQSTGKISHAHTVVSLRGAPVRDAAEVEKEAYERASRADKNVGGLKALHLTNTPLSSHRATEWMLLVAC